jgi:hypothetical protein
MLENLNILFLYLGMYKKAWNGKCIELDFVLFAGFEIDVGSQGWFSPGQIFCLDEYCARYGVRGCFRHLCYLSDLLDRAEKGVMIDPTLMHYSFAFCASHVHGNR